MKINWLKTGRRTYFVNWRMAAKNGASKSGRLLSMLLRGGWTYRHTQSTITERRSTSLGVTTKLRGWWFSLQVGCSVNQHRSSPHETTTVESILPRIICIFGSCDSNILQTVYMLQKWISLTNTSVMLIIFFFYKFTPWISYLYYEQNNCLIG